MRDVLFTFPNGKQVSVTLTLAFWLHWFGVSTPVGRIAWFEVTLD